MKKLITYVLDWFAPLGYEDENGFHYQKPEPKPFVYEVDWNASDWE